MASASKANPGRGQINLGTPMPGGKTLPGLLIAEWVLKFKIG